LKSQADLIRSVVQECILLYPAGDSDIPDGPAEAEEGYNAPYPLDPDSTYYNTATIGPTANSYVKDIRCPGNPGGGDENHVHLFSGASGKFLPPSSNLFSEWKWYNGKDGVFLWIESDKSDAFITSAFDKLENSLAVCEADQMEDDVDMLDEADALKCPADTKCFRIWFIINTPNAHQDGGC